MQSAGSREKAAAQPARSKADEDVTDLTPDQIKSGIGQRHPVAYYILAKKLFAEGAQDEAVFWFYAGQLRYRFYLAANPKLPQDGAPALFASLSSVIGQTINEYAFGDIDRLTSTMDDVLKWDERTDNGFTSKTEHAKEWQEIRTGLARLRDMTRDRADEIRAQRKANGLPNRKP